MMMIPDQIRACSPTNSRGTWKSVVLGDSIPGVELDESFRLAPIKEQQPFSRSTFNSTMCRTPSLSSALSSAYDSSICQPTPVASPRMSHREPTYDHSKVAFNRLSMHAGHLDPNHHPRPSPPARPHSKKVLKNEIKAGHEKDRRKVGTILTGSLQGQLLKNNPSLKITATTRQFRPEGGMRGLSRNNRKHAYAATFDKKDVMELSLICLEHDNIIFGDILQELEEHLRHDHDWQCEMHTLFRPGASPEAYLECFNRRPVLTSSPARIRYSLVRRAGQDFQSPIQLKQ